MRVLIVNKFLYPKGGAETYVFKLGAYLEKAGHDVEYFGMYDEKNIVGNSLGEYTQNMDFHGNSLSRYLYPFRIIYSRQARRKIGKVINDFKPDIIHMNNINFQLTPSIIIEAKRQGIPVVQTVHDLQMLCPNHLMFDINKKAPCEKCMNGTKLNCIKGKCIHGSLLKSVIGAVEAWFYAFKNTYSLVDKYICPSCFIEKKLLGKGVHGKYIYRGKTKTIHNFIELNEVHSEKKKDYVLFFGRLSEEKGVDMMVSAVRELSNIKFVIAGGGPMENAFDGLKNAEFVGFKTGDDLNRLISEALFSVYPSIWYENCPLSVLESESLGTPVVCTPLGGMPELVDNGETGIIIDEVSVNSLVKAIRSLYDDRELCERMSQNCLEKRSMMISLNEYGGMIEEIYQEVLNNH